MKTEREILNYAQEHALDIGTVISLISISRNLRNIASSAIAVSQDLQAKHRPKITHMITQVPESSISALDIFTKGLDYEVDK